MAFLFDVIGSLVVAVIGFLGIIKMMATYRKRKGLWSTFKDTAEELGLVRKEGGLSGYGLPDIFGEMEGRQVYVHPVLKKRGKESEPGKTIYAVEHELEVHGPIVISSPETSSMEEDLYEMDVPSLNKKDYEVRTENHQNEEITGSLFSREVTSKISHMVKRNKDNFRAIIIEEGLLMFSTFGVERSGESIKENLEDAFDLVEKMENGASTVSEVKSQRLEKLSEKKPLALPEIGLMAVVSVIAVSLITASVRGLSYFYMNMGIVVLLVALTRIFVVVNMKLR